MKKSNAKVKVIGMTSSSGKSESIVSASMNNSYEGVLYALRENPNCINDRDFHHMTALHWAGANGNYVIAELLFSQVSVHVDPWIRNNHGKLAGDLAVVNGNQKVIDLFIEEISKINPPNNHSPLDTFEP